MALPPEARLRTVGDDLEIALPHRRPVRAPGAIGCGVPLLGAGGLILLAGAAEIAGPLTRGRVVEPLVILLFFAPFAGVALAVAGLGLWLLAGARSEFRMSKTLFRMRERLGPLVFARSTPTTRIRGFRVVPYQSGLGCLEIDLEGGGSRRWAVDHPLPLLEALAAELTLRREGLVRGAPTGPGLVERVAGGVRLTLPERGWLVSPAWGGFMGIVLILLVLVTLAWARERRSGREGGWTLATIWAAWLGAAVGTGRRARRVTTIELTDEALTRMEVDPLGRRRQAWKRSEVWGYEVGPTPPAEDRPPVLQLRLSNGRRPTLLRGRDEAELDWVAAVLRRARPASAPPPETAAVEVRPGGLCQVCGYVMEADLVACARCATPHHKECWQYTGMCSTYGCREIRARSAG